MTADSQHMRPERSFQGFILALQRFWASGTSVTVFGLRLNVTTLHLVPEGPKYLCGKAGFA